MQIDNYPDSTEALRALTNRLALLVKEKGSRIFNLALSGGDSAKAMFALWASEYRERLPWQQIRYFWVDERCVPPARVRIVITNMPKPCFSIRFRCRANISTGSKERRYPKQKPVIIQTSYVPYCPNVKVFLSMIVLSWG